ncbi:hypothetical protein CSA37_11260 [Candidatus Fermentibacteria bacterium]|nr:MAG: hypothetical protein CSA37_11260 [Candidatus Fermentibacteria bacterium]
MKDKLLRLILPLAVVAVLHFAGIINLSILPFEDADFQITLVTVIIYLVWSVLDGGTAADSSRITLYAVLLVSVLDAFLLRLTVFSELIWFRWAGTVILAAACTARLTGKLPVYSRVGQMTGFALGLGSVAGIIVSLFPGIPSALREQRS